MLSDNAVEIARDVDLSSLQWPRRGESPLSGVINREYLDLRGLSWEDAEQALQREISIAQGLSWPSAQEDMDLNTVLDEEEWEEWALEDWGCLDVGVAAAVAALYA